eukprot:290563-Pleurochrysis_carterae.AAC.1
MYRIVSGQVSGTGYTEKLRMRVFLPLKSDVQPPGGDTLRVRGGALPPGRAGAEDNTKYKPSGVGSRRRSGGWGAPTGWLEEVAQGAAAAILSKVSKSLKSGARALRYACDAMQKCKTVHVSAEMQMKGARDYSLHIA